MEVLSLTISFLGGGILVALINWSYAKRAAQKEREINFLDNQIRNLYGPLYFFVSQVEKLLELNSKFHSAYKEELVAKEWSKDEGTKKILDKETTTTLEIANKYVKYVENNNNKIKEILTNNYSYIDPDDVDIFVLFYEHYIRMNTEINEEGRMVTPLRIYNHIGDISFLRPEFIKRVKDNFLFFLFGFNPLRPRQFK